MMAGEAVVQLHGQIIVSWARAAGPVDGGRLRAVCQQVRQALDSNAGELWLEMLRESFPDTILPEGGAVPAGGWLAALGGEVAFHAIPSLYTILRRGNADWLSAALARSTWISVEHDEARFAEVLEIQSGISRQLLAMRRPLGHRCGENPFFIAVRHVTESWPGEAERTLETPYHKRKVFEIVPECEGKDHSFSLNIHSAWAYVMQPLRFQRKLRRFDDWVDVAEEGMAKAVDWLALAADLLWECSSGEPDDAGIDTWRELVVDLPDAEFRLRLGWTVMVTEQLDSNNKISVPLPVGLKGQIMCIDEDGDAEISFDGFDDWQWVFKDNFPKIGRAQEQDDIGGVYRGLAEADLSNVQHEELDTVLHAAAAATFLGCRACTWEAFHYPNRYRFDNGITSAMVLNCPQTNTSELPAVLAGENGRFADDGKVTFHAVPLGGLIAKDDFGSDPGDKDGDKKKRQASFNETTGEFRVSVLCIAPAVWPPPPA